MNQTPALGLPAAIEAAVRRVKLAARSAAERTVDSLGVSALASANVFQRDALLGAQFELNRKLAVFCNSFDDTLDRRDRARSGCRATARRRRWPTPAGTRSAWSTTTRWKCRSAPNASACRSRRTARPNSASSTATSARCCTAAATHRRNPLRPEVIGNAMIRSVDAGDRPRRAAQGAGRRTRPLAWPHRWRETYAAIVADMRAAGHEAGPARLSQLRARQRLRPHAAPATTRRAGRSAWTMPRPPRTAAIRATAAGAAMPAGRRSAAASTATAAGGGAAGRQPGHADRPRRCRADVADPPPGLHRPGAGRRGFGLRAGSDAGARRFAARRLRARRRSAAAPVAPNLIRAHRDALRQASNGSLDHMVIDVIGSLFDQILSDPKVPPQMARQIARLQLPVLRAALGDPSFFSSRKHPVRRFVNRIASLGSAFDDFDSESGQRFVTLVRELVQEIVEGDFDQIEVYEQKLSVLESLHRRAGAARGAGPARRRQPAGREGNRPAAAAALHAAAAGAAQAAAGGRLRARLRQPGVEPGADARRARWTAPTAHACSGCATPAAS